MSKRMFITDEEVEAEIARLQESEAVKLARAEHWIKNKRRQMMYQLRSLETRGLELLAAGITAETLEESLALDSTDLFGE